MEAVQLDAVDALAAEWLERARPVAFRVASRDELDAVFRLRYRAVVEERWAAPDDFPDGFERDADDERAIHVVGLNGSALVATARLVLPDSGRPLPTEAAFELELEARERFVDLGRMVVEPRHREPGHRVFAGLLGASWREARARGFTGFIGVVSEGVLERYRQLGVSLEILGPARRYWNENRVPVRFAGDATVRTRMSSG